MEFDIDKETPVIAPRKAWLAGLLSLAAFGLGQFYNGQWHRGLWVVLIALFLTGPALVVIALGFPTSLVAPAVAVWFVVGLSVWFGSHWYAWKAAKKATQYRLRSWQKFGAYVVLFLVINFSLFAVAHYVRQHWVQPFHIPTGSMHPTLQIGDVLFADMRVGCATCSKRVQIDDIVIFRTPENPGVMWVKRVVALGGDPMPENETNTVPEGHMFVMGDNRDNSNDSRHIGTIELSNVVGKVRQVYWSRGEEGVRWSRLGYVPE